MPIEFRYDVPPRMVGRLGYETGWGLGRLTAQERAERQRQFDRQMLQRVWETLTQQEQRRWEAQSQYAQRMWELQRRQRYGREAAAAEQQAGLERMGLGAALQDLLEGRRVARELPLPGEPTYARLTEALGRDIRRASALGDMETAQRLEAEAGRLRMQYPRPGEEFWERVYQGPLEQAKRMLEVRREDMSEKQRDLFDKIMASPILSDEEKRAAIKREVGVPAYFITPPVKRSPFQTADVPGFGKLLWSQRPDGSIQLHMDAKAQRTVVLVEEVTLPSGRVVAIMPSGYRPIEDPDPVQGLLQRYRPSTVIDYRLNSEGKEVPVRWGEVAPSGRAEVIGQDLETRAAIERVLARQAGGGVRALAAPQGGRFQRATAEVVDAAIDNLHEDLGRKPTNTEVEEYLNERGLTGRF